MAADDAETVWGTADQLGRSARDPSVRKPVKAVAAQPPSRPPLRRERVGAGGRTERRMEGGVEAGDRRLVRECLRDGRERRQRLRLMQRREIGQLIERARDVLVDLNRPAEALAAVDDPVPDRI